MTEFQASAIEQIVSTTESSDSKPDMEALIATLKSLEPADLFKVMKQALTEAERRSKAPKAAPKKAGSMPKGQVPKQLMKPRAWVDFVMKHATENGWEAFSVFTKKTDKETGIKTEEETEMLGSILHEGVHVYEDSITDKKPSGKTLIHKDAMSLSKHYWTPKDNKGTNEELYREFESSYVEEAVEKPVVESKVVKITAAEKLAAAEEKKRLKDEEKQEKRALKELEKEEKRALKELEKTSKKVPAAAIKSTKAPKAPVKAPVKAKATTSDIVTVKQREIVTPIKVVKKAAWSCPADGMVHHWPYKGKQYFRNSENEVWIRGEDGGLGDWQGLYIVGEDRIDDSVAEPDEYDE